MTPEPGLVVVVNGRPHRLWGIALTETSGHLPVWLVDVDGAKGSAGTLESALLMAARAADAKKEG
jgi:hypothetical protein